MIGIFFLAACNEPAPQKPELSKEDVEHLSQEMNKWDATRQKDEIDAYVKNRGWEMTETGTGLRYMYVKKGEGAPAKNGGAVLVAYKVFLLDGTLCYSSEQDGPRTVRIGKDYVESGLHEALQLMKVGDQMRFILPSHLAHGLTGDDDKIPPRSTVMYEIELLKTE